MLSHPLPREQDFLTFGIAKLKNIPDLQNKSL